MNRWPATQREDLEARFEQPARIGVLLLQQESNTFASRPGSIDQFTVLTGIDAVARLRGANSEFIGACDELNRRGATPVPLLYAHALPSGTLGEASYLQLHSLAITALREAGPIDGLVACLHGSLATETDRRGDHRILRAIRDEVGEHLPIALSLDLHANATRDLVALAQVVTGYRSNPHVDQAATGRRAAGLLAATMTGAVTPTTAVETCPAIFPDESLRIPSGILGEIVDGAVAAADDSIIDVSMFPTQPWLDAPGIGFTSVVIADDDPAAAHRLARTITRAVWQRRHEFVVERLLEPDEALAQALASELQPFIITESADAPTAGAAGDNPAMLSALANWQTDRTVLATIVDAPATKACHAAGPGMAVSLSVGASVDPRWAAPVSIAGEVVSIGEGDYQLTGHGFTDMTVTMGRFAVVRQGGLHLLITELPAWSADPGTWRHAGLDPHETDVLVVRSCTDYMANFPASAATAVVADVPGTATPRLDRLVVEHCDIVPFPIDRAARYDSR
jgi:microcystin degradation protein MlrC